MIFWINWLFTLFTQFNIHKTMMLNDKKYELLKNVRNFKALTNAEMELLNSFNNNELIFIIKIYQQHAQNIEQILDPDKK